MCEDKILISAEELLKLIRGKKAEGFSKKYSSFMYEIEVEEL